jgi:2-polyprenyl-6-methoxyphenol hydroxylase-like FAD-dependent oxidoreductase
MEIVVAGGGISGLATALSLAAAEFSASVFESAPAIEARGLGLQLQPFAVRELAALGLGPELAVHATPIERLSFYNRCGQLVWSESRGKAAGFAWPQYAVNRGVLQRLLLERLRVAAPGVAVVTGHRLESFRQSAAGVVAGFARSGGCAARVTRILGAALVGADGLHSKVRHALYPEQRLRFGGQLMWRNASRRAPLLDGRTAVIAGHRNQKVVVYPMTPADENGRVVLNWLVELASGDHVPPREEWNRPVSAGSIIDRFADWRFPWLDVPALLEEAGEVFEFPKLDRDPVPAWTRGLVTLVGDAAHPITPVGSQGASQAIVDARALAFHLARADGDLVAGLRAYELDRLPLMTAIALRNRAMGAEVMLDLVETRAPRGFDDLETVLPLRERANLAESYRALAGPFAGDLDSPSPYSTA